MNKIKEFRKKANVTQKQLGKNINKSQGAIAHYENQKRRISLATCRDITNFFNKNGLKISIDDVFPPEK